MHGQQQCYITIDGQLQTVSADVGLTADGHVFDGVPSQDGQTFYRRFVPLTGNDQVFYALFANTATLDPKSYIDDLLAHAGDKPQVKSEQAGCDFFASGKAYSEALFGDTPQYQLLNVLAALQQHNLVVYTLRDGVLTPAHIYHGDQEHWPTLHLEVDHEARQLHVLEQSRERLVAQEIQHQELKSIKKRTKIVANVPYGSAMNLAEEAQKMPDLWDRVQEKYAYNQMSEEDQRAYDARKAEEEARHAKPETQPSKEPENPSPVDEPELAKNIAAQAKSPEELANLIESLPMDQATKERLYQRGVEEMQHNERLKQNASPIPEVPAEFYPEASQPDPFARVFNNAQSEHERYDRPSDKERNARAQGINWVRDAQSDLTKEQCLDKWYHQVYPERPASPRSEKEFYDTYSYNYEKYKTTFNPGTYPRDIQLHEDYAQGRDYFIAQRMKEFGQNGLQNEDYARRAAERHYETFAEQCLSNTFGGAIGLAAGMRQPMTSSAPRAAAPQPRGPVNSNRPVNVVPQPLNKGQGITRTLPLRPAIPVTKVQGQGAAPKAPTFTTTARAANSSRQAEATQPAQRSTTSFREQSQNRFTTKSINAHNQNRTSVPQQQPLFAANNNYVRMKRTGTEGLGTATFGEYKAAPNSVFQDNGPRGTRPQAFASNGSPTGREGAYVHKANSPQVSDTNKGVYRPHEVRKHLENKYDDVRSSTVPEPKAKNVKLAGQRHPETGIVFDERGFPIFDDVAVFDTRIPREIAQIEDRLIHMKMATKQLSETIKKAQFNKSCFTEEQLNQIQLGRPKIEGYTWHHHQDIGRMQLVPEGIHQNTGHVGGMNMKK